MNAVGIDVSKRKCTVTILRPGNQVVLKPCDFQYTQSDINALIQIIRDLDGETKVCMEHTGRYYEPVARWLSDADIFVSAVNPLLIKQFGNDSLRTPKTDKADARKIARFTLDRWLILKQYGPMDEIRNQLKTMNRQFGFYMDQKTAMKNNLIALLDQTYPMLLPSTIRNGANAMAMSSVPLKRSRSTAPQLTSSQCFRKMSTQRG